MWCLWFGCTVSLWIGSLYGWFLPHLQHANYVQAFGQLLWKLIAFLLLNLCVSVMINIQKMIRNTVSLFDAKPDLESGLGGKSYTISTPRLPKMKSNSVASNASAGGSNRANRTWVEEEQLAELRTALRKINALILCEVALSIFLMVAAVYESYVIYKIYRGEYVSNVYAESTVMSMVCYFPLWTLIHTVLLVYGWIPSEQAVPQSVQDLVDYVTEETPEGGDPESEPSPSGHGNAPTTSNTAGSSLPSELKFDDVPDLTRFAF